MKSTFNLIDKDEALGKIDKQIDKVLNQDISPEKVYLVMNEETYTLFFRDFCDRPLVPPFEVDFRDGEATYRKIRLLNNDILNIGEVNIAVIM